MKRLVLLLACWLLMSFVGPDALASEAAAEAGAAGGGTTAADGSQLKVKAAAAVAAKAVKTEGSGPDFLEHLVDSILGLFDIRSSGNTVTHYVISALLLAIGLLARRIVTQVAFPILRRLAAKTQTTFDDKLFPALENPIAALVMVIGMFASLKVLKLDETADYYIGKGSNVAFSLVTFWILWRAFASLLEHANEVAKARAMGIAAFMPWIRKTLLTVFVILGVLLTVQSLGYDVKAILAGLGIGGLAFALAAQDTLANIFGAIVVAVDQPFKIGENVRIGSNVGTIEDIGLRSTRIRLLDKSLMVIPNKMVAAETITNLSRFTRRRVEQTIGLTYDTKPEQMEEMVEEIRRILAAEPEIDSAGAIVAFRDFSASSLDIWLMYELPGADFPTTLRCRQRVNMAIMRAVEQRGLSFAFPTQTVHLVGGPIERIAARGDGPDRSI